MKRIRELDEDLETWRYSIPISVRPSLSFSQDHLPIYIYDIRAVMLRLEYHQCIAIIHLAISRCITSSLQHASIVKGIHSSLALSIEASRSTLKYLLAANPTINDHIFWLIIAYPLAGVVVVFCAILESPADEQSEEDLKLLQSSLIAISHNLTRVNSFHEVCHIQIIANFVEELCRLATCAIRKRSWEDNDSERWTRDK
ncbi:Zn(II)2Cys6 transcription factor [Penicillium sp. IBT 35674x]|nr:Zn(II)2Cys6 transcription factor [Penicillium sp. IBT 35674x]